MTAGKLPWLLLLVLSIPLPCRAEILKCVGPKGEIYFTDRGCPAGYSLETSAPTSPAEPGTGLYEREWSRFCESISLMTAEEAGAARASVEKLLPGIRDFNDPSLYAKWEACFSQLKARGGAQTPTPAAEPERTPLLPGRGNPDDPTCREGVLDEIASVSLAGPAGGGIDWNWCKFKY